MAISIFGLLTLLFLAILIATGIWLIIASRKKGLGYPACGQCSYDLSGSIGAATRCPECGAEFAAVGILPARGQRNKVLLSLGIILLVIPFTCGGFVGFSFFMERASVTQARQAQQRAIAAQQAAVAAQQQAQQTPATQPDGPSSADDAQPDGE